MALVKDQEPAGTAADQWCMVHASCVVTEGGGILIHGASGSGKSELALQLMAMGAVLVSDDQTIVHRRDEELWASAPTATRGMIEARGIGLLAAESVARARVGLSVDLDRLEVERLPEMRYRELLGLRVPTVHKVESAAFPAAVLQFVKGGRCA